MTGKRIMAFVAAAVFAAVLGLTGCGGSETKSAPTSTEEKQTTEQSQGSNTSTETKGTESTTTETTTTDATTTEEAPATEETPATETPAATSTQGSYIDAETAKANALAHAGVAATDAMELEAELDTDDAQPHYDVDFKANGMEYDYDIDATTGEVLSYSSEVDD